MAVAVPVSAAGVSVARGWPLTAALRARWELARLGRTGRLPGRRAPMIIDLQDERRAEKSWLPCEGDDRDVTNGLVAEDKPGKPRCWRHGAMNRVDPHRAVYRCHESRCGVGAEVISTGEPRGPYGYTPGDTEPLPSGLLPAERLALAVARAGLERGGPVYDGITAVLVMTVDRLLGGPGHAAGLHRPRPYAFTRAELIEALRRREPIAHGGGPTRT